MQKRGWSKGVLIVGCSLVVLVAWSKAAHAQVVQDCQPTQYLDRTAAGADRQLTWDFSIATDPERCMQVRVGQTVVWSLAPGGSFDLHPLAGSGGDIPNPISSHQNGVVTFNSVGTFGFVCLNHSSMKGAIKVVPAAAVPAISPWLAVALPFLLLVVGWFLIRREAALPRASGRT
jgi:plastocyanin